MPRVILARHGETLWSLSGQHTGRTDIPLTEHGEHVMRVLAPSIVGVPAPGAPGAAAEDSKRLLVDPHRISHIFISPRRRSQRTLQLLLEHLTPAERAQVVKPEIRQECREWDYGACEGLTSAQIRARPGMQNWDIWRDGTPDHPTRPAELPGESAQQMTQRVDAVIAHIRYLQKAVIEGHAETTHDPEIVRRGGDILLIAHGHYNRVFIARWLGLPIENGRLFEVDAGGIAILTYTHHSFDEPAIGGIFSAKVGPKPAPVLPPPVQHEETQYLSLISRIISSPASEGGGEQRADRTGTGTLAVFAPPPFKFDLTQGKLPLLTTKRVFTRGVIEELLWFISGKTDAKLLSDRGVHIWDGNGSLSFLQSRGLGHRREGDLGPVYGFQWRHFGAEYFDADTEYVAKGVDQLREVIRLIKENPTDRRIILSAWNPKDLSLMALPPCHMFCQFFVHTPAPDAVPSTKRGLSCQMYQRSCDLGLGIPFNIASYALLTYMIAHVTDTEPRELTLVMGDAHVYNDHVEPLKEQIKREPYPFPTFKFARQVSDIDAFKPDDFVIENYKCHGKIEMKMAV
ncbi:hypothetical protein K437DRAFT_278827 [Tilletiaria anomala UBC 951]|uniref:thymidylate synthase n=1 Tax=Tilletiaria anomala (strain ATCC 24038 / CBS 436.72 / UBC 951) TaxID=1037660 RepID=A0A066VWB8_TILAU|nr:uncharacterized protein K437DRAFT_278827 [Tilletiaria anomala UBC 951]KDN43109.1 hypothetical protein K437DRAFT_278827 [Tilletiaria anomala UBC 951]